MSSETTTGSTPTAPSVVSSVIEVTAHSFRLVSKVSTASYVEPAEAYFNLHKSTDWQTETLPTPHPNPLRELTIPHHHHQHGWRKQRNYLKDTEITHIVLTYGKNINFYRLERSDGSILASGSFPVSDTGLLVSLFRYVRQTLQEYVAPGTTKAKDRFEKEEGKFKEEIDSLDEWAKTVSFKNPKERPHPSSLFRPKYDCKRSENRDLLKTISAQKKKLEAYAREIEKLNANHNYRAKYIFETMRYNDKIEELSELKRKLSSYEAEDFSNLREQKQELEDRLETAYEANTKLSEEFNRVHENMTKHRAEADRVRDKNHSLANKLSELQNELRTTANDADYYKNSADSIRNCNIEMSKKMMELEERDKEASATCLKLKKQVADLQQELEEEKKTGKEWIRELILEKNKLEKQLEIMGVRHVK